MSDIKSKFCRVTLLSALFLLCSILSLTGFAIPPIMPDSEKVAPNKPDQLPSPDDFVPVEILPEMIYESSPVYPEQARKAGHEGVVWVKALVDKNGNAIQAIIAKTSGYESLDDAALEAATKNKYKPAIQNGRPIAVWVTYKVDFVLADYDGTSEAHESYDIDFLPSPRDFVSVDVYPEIINEVKPIYPEEDRQAGHEGRVWVRVLINIEGETIQAFIGRSSGYGNLDSYAIEAALESRFTPALQNGRPTPIWIAYKIDFVLDDNDGYRNDTVKGKYSAESKAETTPELIYSPEPEYPDKAETMGVEGKVHVKALVDNNGLVVGIKIEDILSDPYRFKETTLEAAFKHRFKPAMLNGKAVAAWVEFEVKFKLE